MDIYKETSTKINFSKGIEITPIVVLEGIELEEKTFSNKTHQIEELINYIIHYKNIGCDVYL